MLERPPAVWVRRKALGVGAGRSPAPSREPLHTANTGGIPASSNPQLATNRTERTRQQQKARLRDGRRLPGNGKSGHLLHPIRPCAPLDRVHPQTTTLQFVKELGGAGSAAAQSRLPVASLLFFFSPSAQHRPWIEQAACQRQSRAAQSCNSLRNKQLQNRAGFPPSGATIRRTRQATALTICTSMP